MKECAPVTADLTSPGEPCTTRPLLRDAPGIGRFYWVPRCTLPCPPLPADLYAASDAVVEPRNDLAMRPVWRAVQSVLVKQPRLGLTRGTEQSL